jgi:6-phosphogluconolactonase (cycloisomerase 2 family)
MAARSWIRRLFAKTVSPLAPIVSRRRRPRKAMVASRVPSLEGLETRIVPTAAPTADDFAKMLYNVSPATFVSGIDKALDNVQADLNAFLAKTDIPIIGNQIQQALQPLSDAIAHARTEVQDQITSLYANNPAFTDNFQDLFQTTVFDIFGPSGLNVLLKGQESLPYTVQSTSPDDVAFTSGYGYNSQGPISGTDWLEFDVHLGQLYRIDLPFQVGEELSKIPGLNLGLQLDGTNGVRLQFTWDLRLGMGIDQLYPSTPGGVGFYLNAGTKDGFGNSVPAFQATVDVYSAPPKDAFGNDIYSNATQGLSGTISLGALQASVSDGTPWVPTVTAPIGLPAAGDFSGSFTLTLSKADGTTKSYPITYNSPGGNETYLNFVARLQVLLNDTLATDFPGDTFPVIVTTTLSRINGILYPGLPQSPSLVLTANATPDINGITVTGGGQYGFVDNKDHTGSQYDENNMSDLDFSSGFSTAQPDGTQVLTSGPVTDKGQNSPVQLNESAAPFLLTDAQMFIDLSSMTSATGPTIAGRRLQVLLREQPNRNLGGLSESESGNNSLQYVLQQLVSTQLTNNGYDPNLITVSIDSNNDVVLTAHPLNGYTAPVMDFDFTPSDRSKLSLTFGITFKSPTYNSTNGVTQGDESTYNWLRFDQIQSAAKLTDVFVPDLSGSAALRLHVTTDFGSVPLLGQTLTLPKISFDLMADASVTLETDTTTGAINLKPSLDDLQFNNVTLDVGSLLNAVAVPVANAFGQALGPITDVLGKGIDDASSFLNKPVAGLNGWMANPPTYLDLLTANDPTGKEAQAIEDLLNAISGVLSFGTDAANFLSQYNGDPINFGSFTYNSSNTPALGPTGLENLLDTSEISLDKFLNKYSNFFAKPGGFNFNLLSISSIVNLLTGNPFDIVSLTLPQLDLSLGLNTDFNILGQVLDFSINGKLHTNLGVYYDSTGIQEISDEARAGQTPNYANLLDGLYIPAVGKQLSISATIDDQETKLDIPGLGSLDVNFNLTAGADFRVIDPAGTGKLRLPEILSITDNFTEPQELFCLFDISGSASGSFSASVMGTNPITGQPYSWSSADLGIPTDFSVNLDLQQLLGSAFQLCVDNNTPVLATPTQLAAGTPVLLINTGPSAAQRLYGNVDDNADAAISARTDPTNGDILVSGFGVTDQRYSGTFDHIVAVGGTGNDLFDFSGVTNLPVSVIGGGGSDTILGGAGNDTLASGAGVASITAGGGNDLIDFSQATAGVTFKTGAGNETVYGSAFNDSITASGNGAVVFQAGDGNDTLVGGKGDATLIAGSGDDSLVGGAGNNLIEGGAGNDTLVAGSGPSRLEAGSGNTYLGGYAGGTAGPNTLIGGQGNDTLVAGPKTAQVDGGDGTNTLILQLPGGSGGTLSADAYTPTGAAAPSLVFTNVQSITVKLGSSGDNNLTIDGVTEALDVEGGGANDTVKVENLPATPVGDQAMAQINLGGGDDKVIVDGSGGNHDPVPGSQRPLTVDGGTAGTNGDTLEIDPGAPGYGTLTATTVSAPGMAVVNYTDFENVTINLADGGGSDFTVVSTAPGASNTVNGGSGDDNLYVQSIAGKTLLNGGGGNNTATVLIPGDPKQLSTSTFQPLTFTKVQTLVVDNSANPSAAGQWDFKENIVSVGGTKILDATGAGKVVFKGGGSTSDSLTVEDGVPVPQIVNVDGTKVSIQEGANVLSPSSDDPFTGFTSNATVAGLGGARGVAVSSDGAYVYSVGSTDNAVSVFRREADGTLTFLQEMKEGQFGVTGIAGADAIAISPDGQDVYVGSATDNAVAIFQRVAATGRLVYRGVYQGSQAITALAFGPGNGNLYGAYANSVFRLNRDTTTGQLSFGESSSFSSHGYASIAVAPEGTYLFAAATDFLDEYSLNGSGHLVGGNAFHTGGYSAVAVGPNDQTVYTTRNGGIDVFSYAGGGLSLTSSTPVPDATNPANGTAVAVAPNGKQVVTSFDTGSVASHTTTYLDLTNVHSYGAHFYHTAPDIYVNGHEVFNGSGTNMYKGTDVPLTNVYDAPITAPTTIELKQQFTFLGYRSLGSITVDPSDLGFFVGGEGQFTLWYAGYELADFSINYNVSTQTTTDSVSSVVTFDRAAADGSISNMQQIAIPGVTKLSAIAISPDSHDFYGTSTATSQVTMNAGSTYLGSRADGQLETVSARVPVGVTHDDVHTIFSPDGQFAYSTSAKFGVVTVAAVDPTTGALSSPIQAVPAGLLDGADLAISPDGKTVYVTNPVEDSVFTYTRDATTGLLTLAQVLTDGVGGVNGIGGASAVTVRPDGAMVYVAGTADNAVAIFTRDATTGLLTYAGKYTDANLSDPSSLTATTTGDLYVTSANTGRLYWLLDSGSSLSTQAVYVNGTNALGMSDPVAVALSPDQLSLYVASPADNSVFVFFRSPTDNHLIPLQQVQNGSHGVQGLDGVRALAVSADGKYVFAGGASDTMAVFGRTIGGLTYLQRLRDGADGTTGLTGVTDFAVQGGMLYVSSAGPDGSPGGVAVMNIATGTPPPHAYHVEYSGMEALTVRSSDGDDTVNAGDVTIPFTLDTGGGSDDVTMRNTPAAQPTTLNLGAPAGGATTPYFHIDSLTLVKDANLIGGDTPSVTVNGQTVYKAGTSLSQGTTVDLSNLETPLSGDFTIDVAYASLFGPLGVGNGYTVPASTAPGTYTATFTNGLPALPLAQYTVTYTISNDPIPEADRLDLLTTGANSTTVVNGSSGGDQISVFATGQGSTTTVNGSAGDDSFEVDGTHLGGPVTVSGGNNWLGDSLCFDAHGQATTPLIPAGNTAATPTLSVKVNGQANGVTYHTVEGVELCNGPVVNAGGPYTIAEGGSLTLDGSQTSATAGSLYQWGIGDTVGVVTGATPPTLTWSQLQGMGINNHGTYTIYLRVTSPAIGDDAEVSVGTATLTVTDVAPTLKATGPAYVEAGALYNLSLSSTEPGTDPLNLWTVTWGDGSPPQTFPGTVGTVGHVFLTPGTATISATGADASGGPYGPATQAVTVLPARGISGPPTGTEGTPYTLTLGTEDPHLPPTNSWTIFWGDGLTSQVNGNPATTQHTYTHSGDYTISALINDVSGSHPAANTVGVAIAEVPPVLTFSGPPTINEGAVYTLSNMTATYKGTESVREWVIDWGDGTSSTLNGRPTSATHIYREEGAHTIRAGVIDENGLHVSPKLLPVTVIEVPPTLTLAGASTTTEGALYTLSLASSDPGYGFINQWTITWGDGTVQTVPGNPSVVTHTFQTPGRRTISATATDQTATYPAGNTVSVLVTAPALAPTIGGLPFAFEGSPYTLNLADNNPTQYPVHGWVINWGDGSPAQTIVGPARSVTHVYKHGGPVTLVPTTNASIASPATTYQIAASVVDSNNTSFAANPLTVGVYNVSPAAVTLSLVKSTISEGDIATLNGSFADPGILDTHTVTIAWGDGSPNTVLNLPAGVLTFSAPHKYLDNPSGIAQGGSFPIGVVVVDKDANFGSGGTRVVVNNVPPSVGSLSGPVIVLPNVLTTWTDTFTDPGILDTHTASINWGDGKTTAATVTESNGSGSITASHAYSGTGSFTITLTVTDKDGGTGTATLVVAVADSVFVLSPHAPGALTDFGNGAVKLPGAIVVDSDSQTALVASGNAQVSAAQIRVAGGDQIIGNASVSPSPTLYSSPVPDPLAGLAAPAASGMPVPINLSAQQSLKIYPGVYSQIQVSAGASLIMAPGVYVIAGGGFSVSGNASVTGNGVMIFNAGTGYSYNPTTGVVSDGGTYGSISLGGTGTISLSAPAVGQPYSGVLVFQSRGNTLGLAIGGTGAEGTSGAIYAPAAGVGLSGNADLNSSIIALTLTVSGNAGAFQLTAGADSNYAVSTWNWISNGVLTVAAQDDAGAAINPGQLHQISEAMSYLNSALGSFGVSLSWAAPGTVADVHIHFAATTPEGGAADGVLGFTTAQDDVYLVSGWNYYNGDDPTGIGAGQYDFLTLATHELAHTVGLGESADPASVLYEYLAPGDVRRTFTDGNLMAINTDADRFMKVAESARGGALAAGSSISAAPGTSGSLIGLMPGGGGVAAWTAAPMVPAPGQGLPMLLVGVGLRTEMPAGGSNDILAGGMGDDVLVGGTGQNLLVGGFAADRVVADAGPSVAPAGAVSGTYPAALDALMARKEMSALDGRDSAMAVPADSAPDTADWGLADCYFLLQGAGDDATPPGAALAPDARGDQ